MTGQAKETRPSAEKVVKDFYTNSTESDYYIPPTLLNKQGIIKKDDIIISFNYRIDRMRQIWSAFCDKDFTEFPRDFHINPANLGIFGTYYPHATQIYEPEKGGIKNTLGEVISRENLDQLRISETEKFNHVTFYFSGGIKEKFPKEERILIPSPKCSSYAEKPAMSAVEQKDALIKRILKKDFSFIVQNFANSDLVGHSGNLEAAKKAITIVDNCLQELVPKLLDKNYTVIITADHGNSDEMIYPNGDPCASHTKNLVPLWILENSRNFNLKGKMGTLSDIAPTVLKILEIKKPIEMTGTSLI
jgi:2,3-bisphosphoglycerate-independent phosphoglycerate mutase